MSPGMGGPKGALTRPATGFPRVGPTIAGMTGATTAKGAALT